MKALKVKKPSSYLEKKDEQALKIILIISSRILEYDLAIQYFKLFIAFNFG